MKIAPQVRTAVRGKVLIVAQRKIFERFRLAKAVKKKYPFQLSGGMVRRVLVSTAMVSDAKLVIANEMTTMLDAISQAQIWHSILKIAKERK